MASVAAAVARNRTTARTSVCSRRRRRSADGLEHARRPSRHHPGGRSSAIAPSTSRTIRCARPLRELLVVGDQQDRLAAPVRSSRSASAVSPLRRSSAPGRLVGEEDGRLVHDRPGDREPLPLAAAERGRELPRRWSARPSWASISSARARPRPRSRPARSAGTADVLADGQVVEQVEELEDEADVRAAEPRRAVSLSRSTRTPVDHDLARRRPVEAADQVEQRRLAAARRAHDRGDAPGSMSRSIESRAGCASSPGSAS